MIVMCEGCETSFQVEDRMIKPTGSKVRCSKCRHVFVAYPAAAADTEEPLTLQEELPAAGASEDTAGLREIDSQLDALFREDASGEDGTGSAATEPELLNVDDLLAGDTPTTGALKAETLGDDLELDLDLGLSLEEAPEEGMTEGKPPQQDAAAGAGEPSIDFSMDLEPSAQAEPEESLPALEELEISLDDLDRLDEAMKPAAVEAPPQADAQSAELELDLDLEALASESADATPGVAADAELGAVLEPAAAGAKPAALPVGLKDDANLELDLSASETPVAQSAGAGPKPAGEDTLDLSDLEAMLEGEGMGGASKPTAATDGIDLELDLGAAVLDEAKGGDMQELDLTAIAGAPEAGPAPADTAADALDFSDISGILDEKPPAIAAAGAEKPAEELDLVFDDEPQAAAVKTEPTPPSQLQEELMLDLETLLEADEEKKPETQKTAAEVTDELDLEFAAGSGRDEAGDLEIEIEPVDEGVEDRSAVGRPAATAAVAVAAAAGATAMAARSGKTTAVTDDFSTDEFTQAGMTGATDLLEPEAAKAAAPKAQKARAPQRSGGLRKLLLTAVGLLVLGIAALVIPRSLGIHVPYLSDVDIPYLSDLEIPFLGKIFQSEPEDTAGNLKIAPVPESVNAEFVDNAGAGRLCVIKGQVRNAYDHPRSFIRVTAKLYDKNKTVAKTATVYVGNVLSRQELAGQDLAAISARFKNKTGTNNLNVGVKPGMSVPFMVVFDALPANLDEYSVEVAGSSK
jgi:predicted Zn finger-like uncharacterized protein